jgi:hypothetical protein
MFLRAFGLTRFAERRQTPVVPYVHRRASVRFPYSKVEVVGTTFTIGHGGPMSTSDARAFIHVCARGNDLKKRRADTAASYRSRPDAMRARIIAASIWRQSRCHEESNYGTHRLPAGKTATEKRARTSCRSGSEAIREATTSIIQDTSPLFEIFEMIGQLQTHRQVKRS